MKLRHSARLMMIPVALSVSVFSACSTSPAGPDPGPTPAGDAIAWFNSTGFTVDLYFPQSDSLVTNAYITGDIPNDILSPASGIIAVLNSFSGNIQVFDTDSSGVILYSLDLPQGSNPYLMSFDGSNLWVTLLLTGQVARVELSQGGSIETFSVGSNPTSIAAAGDRILVGHGTYPDSLVSGGITVLDASSGSVIDSIETPDNVVYMRYFETTGLVHAMTSTYVGDGMISIIHPGSSSILAQISTGGSPGLPDQAGSGFAAGDGWSSGIIYFYSESGNLTSTWNTGASTVTGLSCTGDTMYITDSAMDRIYISLWDSEVMLDTLSAGSSGPMGIVAVHR